MDTSSKLTDCTGLGESYIGTSVAKAMKVLRKLGCCLQIEVGIV